MTVRPTAHHVAAAIVAACRQTGQDPERVARGLAGQSRLAAFAILHLRFPQAPGVMLARCVGVTHKHASVWNSPSQARNRGHVLPSVLKLAEAEYDRITARVVPPLRHSGNAIPGTGKQPLHVLLRAALAATPGARPA